MFCNVPINKKKPNISVSLKRQSESGFPPLTIDFIATNSTCLSKQWVARISWSTSESHKEGQCVR